MDPNQNFIKWSEMAKKFLGEDFWSDVMDVIPTSGPKVDVYHGDYEVLVLVDLPGVEDISQIQLRVQDDTLMIRGRLNSRKTHYEPVIQERYIGDFERNIELGTNVTQKNSSARYRKGVLEIHLPKSDRESYRSSIRIRDR
ncbi:Hsp20/alpha crystallin family protein [Melghirimyces algeriensis]|uniref:HSP20 family protein n=1 Tax=Melghirimyces algeriensis TaxID=910412 RepID=A0A521DV84_9BACL|nr:Hsp20/alpha crystallin family protein [Melghirimyces algeriensis]SMO75634.1 HSP20 family protein [Melghirimyces algeriensis]